MQLQQIRVLFTENWIFSMRIPRHPDVEEIPSGWRKHGYLVWNNTTTGWWWREHDFYVPIYWEFFRGVGIPPTRQHVRINTLSLERPNSAKEIKTSHWRFWYVHLYLPLRVELLTIIVDLHMCHLQDFDYMCQSTVI